MHDGAFTSLRAAIRHHLDVVASARAYDPAVQRLPRDLLQVGPVDPILARLDPLVATPNLLSSTQLDDLIAFVRDGLLDPRATPDSLRHLIPQRVPSGRPLLQFELTH
jgi:cytochrome c peroxidase